MRKYLRIGAAQQDMTLQQAKVYSYDKELRPAATFNTLQHQIEFHIALPLIHRTDPKQSGISHSLLEKLKHFELSLAQEPFPNSKFQLLYEFTLSSLQPDNKVEFKKLFGTYSARGLLSQEEV
jgi:hypothetical protein